jgi:hypothetical protein
VSDVNSQSPTGPAGRSDVYRRLDHSYLLGQVIFEASLLEYHLRGLCSALIGSKYGAVISAGQSSSWLMDTSLALARAHDDVGDYATDELRDLMTRCREALRKRNQLVHGLWSESVEGEHFISTSRLRSFEESMQNVTMDDIEDLGIELSRYQDSIHSWLHEWLPDQVGNEVQLRWEAYLRSLPPEERESLLERRRLIAEDVDDAQEGE